MQFTVDIPVEEVAAAIEFGGGDDRTDLRWFLAREAEGHVANYLWDNGIHVQVKNEFGNFVPWMEHD